MLHHDNQKRNSLKPTTVEVYNTKDILKMTLRKKVKKFYQTSRKSKPMKPKTAPQDMSKLLRNLQRINCRGLDRLHFLQRHVARRMHRLTQVVITINVTFVSEILIFLIIWNIVVVRRGLENLKYS